MNIYYIFNKSKTFKCSVIALHEFDAMRYASAFNKSNLYFKRINRSKALKNCNSEYDFISN